MSKIINFIITALMLWLVITTGINRFTNIDKTETQLFLDIPKSFVLNFKQQKQ